MNFSHLIKSVFIVIFLTLLSAPLICGSFFFDTTKTPVERNIPLVLSTFSKDSIANNIRLLTNYYNQRFGLRAYLIYGYNNLLAHLFHVSANPKIVMGQKGWLYYDGDNHVIDRYYRGQRPFTERELIALTHFFQKRNTWLKKQGILYYLVITPNKETIYPDYLPRQMQNRIQQTPVEQFIRYARQHSDLPIIYLRDALFTEKKTHSKLYYKTDSHWNDLGAYFGYRELMKQLAINSLPLTNFHFKKSIQEEGDLKLLLNFISHSKDNNITLIPDDRCQKISLSENQEKPSFMQPYAISCPDKTRSVMVFHDSFFKKMVPYFATHFKKSSYFWQIDLDKEKIQKEKPAMVIQEMVERFLDPEILI